MGDGEGHLYKLHVYFKYCSIEERAAYEAKYPEPPEWLGWYSDDREEVGGAELPVPSEEARIKTLLSKDKRRLALIGMRPDGLYRVHIFVKVCDTGLVGTYWSELGDPLIVDSFQLAERLAGERL
jgi:hypothetical protein